MPTRHRAHKHIYLGLGYEKSGNQVPYISDCEKHLEGALKQSVQIGCDAFPNELVWFHIEATPIWEKIQKQCKNAVIC